MPKAASSTTWTTRSQASRESSRASRWPRTSSRAAFRPAISSKREAVKPEDIKLEFGEERKRQETEGSQAPEQINFYFGKT